MQFHIIRNEIEPDLYWSNEYGWVDNSTYDVFTSDDKKNLNLPFDGKWVCLDWIA